MTQPRLSDVTRLFVRVGTTVFGGGFPAIAILEREFDRRKWLSPQKFALAFGLARLTPGTNFLAFCAATGWYLVGLRGAFAAVVGSTVSAAVLVVWLTRAGELGNHYPLARAVIAALVAAGVGTMLGAAVVLVRSQCSRKEWLRPVAIAVAAFVLAAWFGLSPLSVIGISAAIGFFWTKP
jgi:chromate transporter